MLAAVGRKKKKFTSKLTWYAHHTGQWLVLVRRKVHERLGGRGGHGNSILLFDIMTVGCRFSRKARSECHDSLKM